MTTPSTFYDHAMSGAQDGRPGETPSLEETSQLWSERASGGYKPTSTLGQYRLSANGSSPRDAERQMPDGSYMPTTNGSAQASYDSDTPLRLIGNIE